MNQKTLKSLEYNKIKELLTEKASSNLGKNHIANMMPSTDPKIILNQYQETVEAVEILGINKSIPLGGIRDVSGLYKKIEIGSVLRPYELIEMADFLRCMRNFKKFMSSFEFTAPRLYQYSLALSSLKDVEDEIEYCIEGSEVSSRASSNLEKTRKKIKILEDRIIAKLTSFLANSSNTEYLQDNYYSIRNGKYVVPIKAQCRRMIKGSVVDSSSSGGTVYIELESVTEFTNEIAYLKSIEEEECYQVLVTLTGLLETGLDQINSGIEVLGKLDFIFAKAKFSVDIDGKPIEITDDETINLRGVKHPLIGKSCKPIDIKVGGPYRSLVITGPNTGGKTITLKMVGITALLVQSGILPPVKEGSSISIFNKIFVDIGDSQNIEQSLSTFSGHMENLVYMLEKSSRRTLIIIDEIGTGTDPREGAALGSAILEEFYDRGAITVATTHYGEIKDFTDKHEGFMNASMDFNKETLEPYYKLLIGVPGHSNAFYISEKLGLKKEVLKRSLELMGDKEAYKISESDDSPIKARNFSPKKDRISIAKSTNESGKYVGFKKGDRAINNETKKIGLVYECDLKAGTAKVLIDGKYETWQLRRMTLDKSRDVLYPEGYDLDQLFISFKVRKLEKDIKKGRFKNFKELKERIGEL